MLRFVERCSDRQSLWLKHLLTRRHKNVVVIALANKLARAAWAVLAQRQAYKAS